MSQTAALPSSPPLEEIVEVMQHSGDSESLPLRRVKSQKQRRMSRASQAFDSSSPLSPSRAWASATYPVSPKSSPSSPLRPSSPLSFRMPSSPREHFLRKKVSLSIRPSTAQVDDTCTDHNGKVTTRLRSSSSLLCHHQRLERFNRVDSRRRSVDLVVEKHHEGNRMDDAEYETQMNRRDKPAIHFRPVAYEVKAELDNFFGQTKSQKRELALRTRGDDGRLWYDGAEQEEFAHLLRAQPDSPLTKSRRSSAATSTCRSPTTNRPRGGSVLTSRPLIAASPNFQDVAAFTYLTMQQLQLLQLAQRPQEAMSYRRRKRNSFDLHRGNKVIDDEPLQTLSSSATSGARGEEELGKPTSDIVMPAFLPIRRHHQARTTFLDEAFSNTRSTPQDEVGREDAVDPFEKTGEKKAQGQRRQRPTGLYLIDREESIEARPRRRLDRPVSMVTTPKEALITFHNSFQEGEAPPQMRRRGSSFDSVSPARVRFEYCDPFQTNSTSPISSSKLIREKDKGAKAAALLGKNPLNERLLAPGGLPTGSHVYDGLEIPCRSVHLASDDEDGEGSGGNLKNKRSRSNLRLWLKSKAGG